jgi:hypothetical protein
VIGTDNSPIQPNFVPPNLEFQLDGVAMEWTFEADRFDYIYMRYLLGYINDWPALYRQAFRCCMPGGFVESCEPSVRLESSDGSVHKGSALDMWGHHFQAAGEASHRSFHVVEDDIQQRGMMEAGFINLHVTDYRVREPPKKTRSFANRQDPPRSLGKRSSVKGHRRMEPGSLRERHRGLYIAHRHGSVGLV